MMMLAYLNDQSAEGFYWRDQRVESGLRHARNAFKPWEKEITFVGYWESGTLVKCENKDVRISFYQRPDAALLIIGNVGAKEVEATIEPQWDKLKLDKGKIRALNIETGQEIPFQATSSGKGFKLAVPRHDLRLVLISLPGKYEPTREQLGTELPLPKTVLKELSDPLAGPEMSAQWTKEMPEGSAGAEIVDGRLCLWAPTYGYAHVRRELGKDNVSVQCLIMRAGTGMNDLWCGSLFLYWPNGEYAQATPGTGNGKFTYCLTGAGTKYVREINKRTVPFWYPYYANWVKIVLKPETIDFYGSSDGKTWVKDWEAKRGEKHKGAPQYIILGSGGPGKEPLLKNVQKSFEPKAIATFYSDLVVGQE